MARLDPRTCGDDDGGGGPIIPALTSINPNTYSYAATAGQAGPLIVHGTGLTHAQPMVYFGAGFYDATIDSDTQMTVPNLNVPAVPATEDVFVFDTSGTVQSNHLQINFTA